MAKSVETPPVIGVTSHQSTVVKPIWKCRAPGCNNTAPPTIQGFNKLSGHQGQHSKEGVPKGERGSILIDENSGEILANTLSEAIAKGLVKIEPPPVLKPPPGPTVKLDETASTRTAEEIAKAGEGGSEEGVEEPTKGSIEGVAIAVVDAIKETGEVSVEGIAAAIKGAVEEATGEGTEEAVEGEPEEAAEEGPGEEQPIGKGKEGELKYPEASLDGIIRYTMTLPADAFAMFNMAKACGLEPDKEMPFDEWVFACIQKRYETDYKVQIVLAKLEGV